MKTWIVLIKLSEAFPQSGNFRPAFCLRVSLKQIFIPSAINLKPMH